MICYLLYNRDTPAERTMTDLVERLEREDVQTELLDADSPRGIQMAEHYDVMARPAILLLKEQDGVPVQIWQGSELPLIADISYMAHQ